MKKILVFTLAMAFTASMSAQINISTDGAKAKKEVTKVYSADSAGLEGQIKSALIKDEGLQRSAMNYLKSNPETAKSMLSAATKSEGSSTALIKTVLGNKELTAAAIEYISSNPELLSRAMKIIGM